jgi:hypothetical protein
MRMKELMNPPVRSGSHKFVASLKDVNRNTHRLIYVARASVLLRLSWNRRSVTYPCFSSGNARGTSGSLLLAWIKPTRVTAASLIEIGCSRWQPCGSARYAPGRGHQHATVLLGGYRGILQYDGYAV